MLIFQRPAVVELSDINLSEQWVSGTLITNREEPPHSCHYQAVSCVVHTDDDMQYQYILGHRIGHFSSAEDAMQFANGVMRAVMPEITFTTQDG